MKDYTKTYTTNNVENEQQTARKAVHNHDCYTQQAVYNNTQSEDAQERRTGIMSDHDLEALSVASDLLKMQETDFQALKELISAMHRDTLTKIFNVAEDVRHKSR